jgi:hypothetical protein
VVCRGFYDALKEYDGAIRQKENLRAKGSAWLAGFPIRNSEIELSGGTTNLDFIGPDIDAGFRLSPHTRPGRLLISMDTADVLSTCGRENNFNYHHVGWAVLKGVHEGKPYPLVWVRDEEEPKRFAPWDDHDCSYTRSFLDASSKRDQKQIIDLAKQVRANLPGLKLFRPYWRVEDMPEEHRAIWQKWDEDKSKEEQYEHVGLDEDAVAVDIQRESA